MTIHKAKGLEFDHVIIPRIDRATRFDERKLMLWFELPQIHGGSSLLLAPIEASGSEADPIYQYLQLVEQKKSFYETGRLLYVALTRAKKTAHLIGCIKQGKERSNTIGEVQKDSLLTQLKPCFNENWILDVVDIPISAVSNGKIHSPKELQRLSKDWIIPVAIKTSSGIITPSWHPIDNQAAVIGTAIHCCLRQISEGDLTIWTDEHIEAQKPYWYKLLRQLGYVDIDHGMGSLLKAIKLTLIDERGQWILAKHKEAASEFAITTKINGKLENFIIDRTFIDGDGVRWIIDYKTSIPSRGNIQEFLSQEQAKYKQQLSCYAKIMHEFDPTRLIKLGLYFPLFNGWIEVNQA